jgi:hypothetical protein
MISTATGGSTRSVPVTSTATARWTCSSVPVTGSRGADGKFTFVNVAFTEPEALGTQGNVGGAHMFAYDVDGDGDADIITSLNSHGWGLAWFEQTAPGKFTKHLIVHKPEDAAQYNNIAFSQIHALVVKLARDAQGAHYEPHLVDDKTGTGRQFQVGHLDKNGTLDIVIGDP